MHSLRMSVLLNGVGDVLTRESAARECCSLRDKSSIERNGRPSGSTLGRRGGLTLVDRPLLLVLRRTSHRRCRVRSCIVRPRSSTRPVYYTSPWRPAGASTRAPLEAIPPSRKRLREPHRAVRDVGNTAGAVLDVGTSRRRLCSRPERRRAAVSRETLQMRVACRENEIVDRDGGRARLVRGHSSTRLF